MSPGQLPVPAGIGPQQLLRQSPAVVQHLDLQLAAGLPGPDPDFPVLRPVHAVEHGVFHQRLQDHLGGQAVGQLLRQVQAEGDGPGHADVLDLHIPLQDLRLPPQGDKLLRGDAKAQDVGQVGGHHRHLGHLVDLADPLHGVQGVAQEMGV